MLLTSNVLLALSAAQLWLAQAYPTADSANLESVGDAVALDKRQGARPFIALCSEIDFKGRCIYPLLTDRKCFNVPADFNDLASSAQASDNTVCFLYSNGNCDDDSRVVLLNSGERVPNLSSKAFNNVLSSVLCGVNRT